MPHPQNMKREENKTKKRGEAIWKPDLDMDTWSDARQTKLFRQKRGSGIVPDQILPCNKVVYCTPWIQIELKDEENKTKKKMPITEAQKAPTFPLYFSG